jgi:hypothetical protein
MFPPKTFSWIHKSAEAFPEKTNTLKQLQTQKGTDEVEGLRTRRSRDPFWHNWKFIQKHSEIDIQIGKMFYHLVI